ncbi:TetR/AcrR family transcriptional regulator [Streptomyces sp. MS06]|uniref:TetR/AcrR family transcriptional regulator n=1 Tax=Streptomyces sp. MS06 TaxID=3385974 RepID=UPI0039A2B326
MSTTSGPGVPPSTGSPSEPFRAPAPRGTAQPATAGSSSAAPPTALSLTERRKAETRMAIARAAAHLFATRGLRATRAEDIAQAAGVAPRTFYRYFATKEEAVAPLYAAGARRWTEAVLEAPQELNVPDALRHAAQQTLVPGRKVSAASWEWVRTLIRMATAGPALRRVWAEVCHASEQALAEAIARRTVGGDAEAAARLAAAPEFRFAAAAASAAVRVAVECWAVDDAGSSGGAGPAEPALRNLRALRDFDWERFTPAGPPR